MGQGANREIKRRTIEHADDIDRIKNALQISTESHTNIGPLYKLKVIDENG
ncbi:hypothetical protein BFZC1_10392 [Lysinibacillus fusiformis ZC1]|nr:hypothetical protein BFZC1_10392 [Lysinibacillus fusiformis ZC1]